MMLCYLRLSVYGGLCLCAANQFLLLYWSPGYAERMTTSKSFYISLTMRLAALVICIIGFLVDDDIGKCSNSRRPICDRFSERIYLWTVPPQTIVILVIIGVTIYVSKQVLRLQQTVAPIVVNLPTISQSAPSHNKRNGNEIEMVDLEADHVKKFSSQPKQFMETSTATKRSAIDSFNSSRDSQENPCCEP